MFVEGLSFGAAVGDVQGLSLPMTERFSFFEIPIASNAFDSPIVQHLKTRCKAYALHSPSNELISNIPSFFDMQSISQVEKMLAFISEGFQRAVDVMQSSPHYLVFHYPLFSSLEDREFERIHDHYLNGLNELGDRFHVPLLVENIAVDSRFCTARHYRGILDRTDGMCFDMGHAYTMGTVLCDPQYDGQLSEMADMLCDNVRAVHLYTTVRKDLAPYSHTRHYPFLPEFSENDGFLPRSWVLNILKSFRNLNTIVYEPHRIEAERFESFGTLEE